MTAALLLAWALAVPPRLLEVRSESVENRPALVVVAAAPLGEVGVARVGPDLVVRLAVTAPAALAMPAVSPPLEALRIVRAPDGVQLLIRVPAEVTYEVRRDLNRIVMLFGPAPSPSPPPSSANLYRGLFPSSVTDSEPAVAGTPAVPAEPPAPERSAEEKPEGLHLGTLTLKPSATLAWVDADVSLLETPVPVRDHYAEARPALGVELPLRDGFLRLDYEARIREYSSFEQVNGVSHQANAGLEYPVGPAVTVRGTGHFARGVLEATEVDPGGEYFYSLGHFTRRQFGAGLRFNAGSRFDVDVGGTLDKITVDHQAAFYDYERRVASGGLGVEIGPGRRASLVYSFEQVPAPPERPESESRVHSLSGVVEGEILPLLSGRAAVGYTRRDSPQAPGQRFRGLTFGAELRRDFGRSAHLAVSANRSTDLSAYEQNAFYVSTSVQAILTAPLPLSLSFTAGGGYHVNRYPTAASTLGVARRDEIVSWLAGIGRSITRWAFVRADYRHDRRDSNVDFFDQRTHSFYAELGLGFFGQASRR